MATFSRQPSVLFRFSLLTIAFCFAESQPFVSVNYDQVTDNLPSPEATVKLLKSTTIGKVKLYDADPVIIRAPAHTGIGIVIGVANGDVPSLVADPN